MLVFLWPYGLFYCQMVYFLAIWYNFPVMVCIFFIVFVCYSKKNLATPVDWERWNAFFTYAHMKVLYSCCTYVRVVVTCVKLSTSAIVLQICSVLKHFKFTFHQRSAILEPKDFCELNTKLTVVVLVFRKKTAVFFPFSCCFRFPCF
jgi:hypothetical protein